MSAHLASRRPAARAWYGPLPIAAGLIAWALLIAGWRVVVAPRLPAPMFKLDPAVARFVDVEGWDAAAYLRGSAHDDALLVVGDSRAKADVSLRVLAEHGIAPAGLLTAGLGQLDHLIAVARTLPPRRLLICLSPASVYAEPPPNQAVTLELERAMGRTQRIDARLDDELDVLRQRLVRPLRPARWGVDRPANTIDPDAQTGIYRRVLGRDTRADRRHHFNELRRELNDLRRDGWRVACVRLPASPSIHELEERTFPAAQFQRLCDALQVPYLDLMGEHYDTQDGSHLLGSEADRVSGVIARWLVELPDYLGH